MQAHRGSHCLVKWRGAERERIKKGDLELEKRAQALAP
jgi:hypothetical protein